MKIILNFIIILIGFTYESDQDLKPGVDRWVIKTKVEKITAKVTPVALKDLLKLPLLKPEYSTDTYSATIIPEKVGNLREGELISTKGYLHLVALEKDQDNKDGDYHIQLTLKEKWSDSCFIVEIPASEFVSNKTLKDLCIKNRKFIRKDILKSEIQEPKNDGSTLEKGIYVKVTGQLFYDAHHAGEMRNPDKTKRKYRGKMGDGPSAMHSYTAWEIHPVTNIEPAKQ